MYSLVSNALARLCITCFVPTTQAVEFAVKLREVVEKGGFDPRFLGGGGTPDFRLAYFQIAFTSEHVAGFR